MTAEHPPRRRHVWVHYSQQRWPGLVITWRRVDDGWQAYVATVRDSSVLVTWHKAADLHPVRDDGWTKPPRWTRGPGR